MISGDIKVIGYNDSFAGLDSFPFSFSPIAHSPQAFSVWQQTEATSIVLVGY